MKRINSEKDLEFCVLGYYVTQINKLIGDGHIRVSGSSTGTASPIQIDGRENCVTEIWRLEAALKGSATALF